MSGRVDYAHFFVPKAVYQPPRDLEKIRRDNERAMEEFLKRGGTVTEVAPGVSGEVLSFSDAKHTAKRSEQSKRARERRKQRNAGA